MPVALEVTQQWGEAVLESRQFADGDVVIGSSSGTRWRFLGVDMGFVPAPVGAALSWAAPFWADVERTYRADLLVPASELPDEADWTLFTTRDGVRVARLSPDWSAEAELKGERFDVPGLLAAGLAHHDEDGTVVVPMVAGLALQVSAGGQVFTAHLAPRPAYVPVRPEPDHAFLAVALPGSLAFVGLALLASLISPLRTETSTQDPDAGVHLVDIAVPPPPATRPSGTTGGDASKTKEGPKAKAPGPGRSRTDAVKQAGVLSGIDRILGAHLPDGLVAAIGTMTGPNGHGIGGGGIGDRGDGFGGGGEADGFEGPVGTGLGDGVSGCCGDGTGKEDGVLAAPGGPPIVIGSLDKAAIDEVIKRNMAQIRYCYQRELQKSPDLEGKVTVKFTISKDGTVSGSEVRSSTLGSAAVESCVAGRFLRMAFPEPKGGGIVVVSYPFLFGR